MSVLSWVCRKKEIWGNPSLEGPKLSAALVQGCCMKRKVNAGASWHAGLCGSMWTG